MERDEIVYQSGSIVISKTLARFGETSYPINGIGSVFIAAPNRLPYFLAAIFVAVAGVWIGDQGIWLGFAIGLLVALAAFGRMYVLILRTASGDQQAMRSCTAKSVSDVKDAIERAVIQRG
jgi:hypothetical protein